ncbi:unnamed protein product [Anisakis simplex]|uniref:Repressor of RNA polymerase III transcription MAF1 homolog n=1 Tax=Anisakis simplex TaxID=6269 RepID=A0A0M3IY34_ANISI|nr:unnamed protein product [Anisakis simplex]
MKYLENANLDRICSVLSSNAIDCQLDMRLEAYSCKMVSSEKKQWKKNQLTKGSPFVSNHGSSRYRHLSEPSCSGSDNDNDEVDDLFIYHFLSITRTLFDLIGVLNTSFPDYDFSHIKSESFSLIPNIESLVGLVDLKLSATVSNYYDIKEALWREIDEIIKINECRLYRYLF